MLNTSFAKLHEAGACEDRYRFLARALGGVTRYGKDTLIPMDKLLEINGLDDALWALRALIEPADREIRLLASDYAEHVLSLFEDKYPDDKRPRQAIGIARQFANGRATNSEREVAAGGDDWVAGAAGAALAAARAAGNSWAAGAASFAADWARWAAGTSWAVDAEARLAAGAAGARWAAGVAKAAWAAGAAAEQEWQYEKLLEILRSDK